MILPIYKKQLILGFLITFGIFALKTVSAQAPLKPEPITFNSLADTYYLSRDSQNHSLLTTQEVILTDFPGSTNYYGITRSIPTKYQGRNVDVKVKNITNVAGDAVPFKTAKDKNGNLVITTGDPAISIYGTQTFRINYQTKDVVNTKLANDQFLLDVNGRGWDQPFGSVTGIIHIPKSFASNLIGKPSCYIGYLSTTTDNCSIDTKSNTSETIVTVRSQSTLPAHHALVAKINFKAATFSVKQVFWSKWKGPVLALLAALIIIAGWYALARRTI